MPNNFLTVKQVPWRYAWFLEQAYSVQNISTILKILLHCIFKRHKFDNTHIEQCSKKIYYCLNCCVEGKIFI